MKKPEKVTVVIATFNAAASLEATLDSCAAQNWPALEVVVIDGGSTDATVEILKRRDAEIAFWISENDRGIYDALNKGTARATGDWVIFMGSDDVFWDEKAVSTAIGSPKIATETAFVYGDAVYKKRMDRRGGAKNLQQLIAGNICHQAIFYRKAVLETLGGYDLKYPVLADYELNLRLFRAFEAQTLHIDAPICLFNDVGGTTSRTVLDMNFHADMLARFVGEWGIGANDWILHQYHFYHGLFLVKKAHPERLKGLFSMAKGIVLAGRRSWFFGALALKLLFFSQTKLR